MRGGHLCVSLQACSRRCSPFFSSWSTGSRAVGLVVSRAASGLPGTGHHCFSLSKKSFIPSLRQLTQPIRFNAQKSSRDAHAQRKLVSKRREILKERREAKAKSSGGSGPGESQMMDLYRVPSRIYQIHVLTSLAYGFILVYAVFIGARLIRVGVQNRNSEAKAESEAKVQSHFEELYGEKAAANQQQQAGSMKEEPVAAQLVEKKKGDPMLMVIVGSLQIGLVLVLSYQLAKFSLDRALTVVVKPSKQLVQVQNYPFFLNYILRNMKKTWSPVFAAHRMRVENHPKDSNILYLVIPGTKGEVRQLQMQKKFVINHSTWKGLGIDLPGNFPTAPPASESPKSESAS